MQVNQTFPTQYNPTRVGQNVPPQYDPAHVPGYLLAPLPQDTGNSPKTRPGYKPRVVTAAMQALIGTILVICGVVVLTVRFPDEVPVLDYETHDDDEGDRLDHVDRQVWAIWMGLLTAVISIFGFLSKRSQTLISVYMAFSILNSFVAFMGIIVGAQYVSRTVTLRNQLIEASNEITSYFDPCDVGYIRFGVTLDPITQLRYDACVESHLRAAKTHLPFYCIMLICFVTEFVVAIVAASFTCVGLECCYSTSRTQNIVYYQQQPHVVQPQVFPPPVNVAEPPPPYHAVNFQQSPSNHPVPQRRASPATPTNQSLPHTTGPRDNGAYLEPDSSRGLQATILPSPPQQQVDSTYLEPNATGGSTPDATYVEPNSPSYDTADYVEPNAGPAQGRHHDRKEEHPYAYADPREGGQLISNPRNPPSTNSEAEEEPNAGYLIVTS